MRKAERKKVYAFEVWYWRRVMMVKWVEANNNNNNIFYLYSAIKSN